jgi:ribosomal protein L37AE/L43A
MGMSGLFTKLGRQVEQFKQDVDAAAAENADYECPACEARFAVEREECSNCGSAEIAPREPRQESE